MPAADTPAIRRASLADAKILADLGARTFTETFGHLYPPTDLAAFLAEAYSLERIGRDLTDPRIAVWLAQARGDAIGFARAGPCALPHPQVTAACGEIKSLYLLKAAQAAGLGGRLFAAAMAWLAEQGRHTVWLGVWEDNHGAQRFYRRHGFETVGEYGFRVGGTIDRELILRSVRRAV